MNTSCKRPLQEQFEHHNVANFIENERFELKHVVNTVEIAASSSKCCNSTKMLQIPWKMEGSNSKMRQIPLPPPKSCKEQGKWTEQEIQGKKNKTGKKLPKTISDPM
jgi:hypothetical protein